VEGIIFMLDTIVIIALLIYIAVSQYITVKEREKLLKLFKAKDLQEVTANEVIEKTKEPLPFKAPENVSMDDVIEDEVLFDKHIAAVQKQAKDEYDKQNEFSTPI
jgi:hypothetical protein